MKTLKPAIAFMLMSAFAFNLLGYCLFSVLILTHKKSTFHKIIQGRFKQGELVTIPASDLKNAHWEHEKEFEWNHHMYDIVKTENKNGDILYTCKKDDFEDHLKKQKRKAAEKSAAKKMAEMNKIFIQHAFNTIPEFIQITQKKNMRIFQNKYLFIYAASSNPPPKA